MPAVLMKSRISVNEKVIIKTRYVVKSLTSRLIPAEERINWMMDEGM